MYLEIRGGMNKRDAPQVIFRFFRVLVKFDKVVFWQLQCDCKEDKQRFEYLCVESLGEQSV